MNSQRRFDESNPPWAIVEQVLSYFVRNPRAADTLEGVARWRLLQDQVSRTCQETEVALQWLVDQGQVETVPTGSSSHIVQLMPTDRFADAARFSIRSTREAEKKDLLADNKSG
jgi:hypothetical protein